MSRIIITGFDQDGKKTTETLQISEEPKSAIAQWIKRREANKKIKRASTIIIYCDGEKIAIYKEPRRPWYIRIYDRM